MRRGDVAMMKSKIRRQTEAASVVVRVEGAAIGAL